MLLETLDEDLLHSVRRALAEDIGSGDLTASAIPESATITASVICREAAVLCGCHWFDAVFAEIDSRVQVHWQARDGDRVDAGQVLCTLAGPARAILTGERTALNFLQMLSGTATLAARYADSVADLPIKILDTRKTIPGLRMAQKYAVRTGGCHNHRSGLYDAILVKENHIRSAGSIRDAVSLVRQDNPDMPVEVEVENRAQLEEALQAGAERVLLDNFSQEALREAARVNDGRAELEASGGITLDNLRATALTGVDYISVGEITKSLYPIDLTMLVD